LHPASIVSHRVELADLDRGYVTGLREGFVLLHARRLSGRLLSATVVGPHASEVIQLLTWAQRRRLSLWQLSRHVVAYPALAEGIKRAADAFVFATLPALPRELAAYLRLRWRRPPAPPLPSAVGPAGAVRRGPVADGSGAADRSPTRPWPRREPPRRAAAAMPVRLRPCCSPSTSTRPW
jgi:hypothetical protein